MGLVNSADTCSISDSLPEGVCSEPPRFGTRVVRNSINTGIDSILSSIEGELRLKSEKRTLKAYLWELKLLNVLGILSKSSKVFNPFTGADLFPGLFASEMYTSDFWFLSSRSIRRSFKSLWKIIRRDYEVNIEEILPSFKDLCSIYHNRTNIVKGDLVSQWVELMRPGDVVFMKFSEFDLLMYGATREETKRFFEDFVKALPTGVYVILYDYSHHVVFPNGFKSYLLNTGLFEDQAKELLSPRDYSRLEQINDNFSHSYVSIYVGKETFSSAGGSKLYILKKK